MKRPLFVVMLACVLVGCRSPQVAMYDNTARIPTTSIDLYRDGQKPSREYKEIGEVSFEHFGGEEARATQELITKAKEMGANGIILFPRQPTGFEFNPFGRSGDKFLWKAVAVIYK